MLSFLRIRSDQPQLSSEKECRAAIEADLTPLSVFSASSLCLQNIHVLARLLREYEAGDHDDVFCAPAPGEVSVVRCVLNKVPNIAVRLQDVLERGRPNDKASALTATRILCEYGSVTEVRTLVMAPCEFVQAIVQECSRRFEQASEWDGASDAIAALHAIANSSFAPILVRRGLARLIPRWATRASPAHVAAMMGLLLSIVTDDDVRANMMRQGDPFSYMGLPRSHAITFDKWLASAVATDEYRSARTGCKAVRQALRHLLKTSADVDSDEDEEGTPVSTLPSITPTTASPIPLAPRLHHPVPPRMTPPCPANTSGTRTIPPADSPAISVPDRMPGDISKGDSHAPSAAKLGAPVFSSRAPIIDVAPNIAHVLRPIENIQNIQITEDPASPRKREYTQCVYGDSPIQPDAHREKRAIFELEARKAEEPQPTTWDAAKIYLLSWFALASP